MATLVGRYASISSNGWRAANNAWNVGNLVYGQDYSVTTTYNPDNIVDGTTFNWQFPTATGPLTVKAYPEVFFGASPKWGGTNPTDPNQVFPIAVSNLQSLTANYNLSLSGYTQGNNVAYEMWLTSAPNGGNTTITNEIMIWVHKGEFNPPGTVVGTYHDPHFTGTIYNQPHTGDGITAPTQWNYTAIVANSDDLTGTVDLAAILRDLEKRGIVTGSPYLADVELGAEVVEGQGSLTVNNLDYNVRTKNGTNTTLGGFQVASGSSAYAGSLGTQTSTIFGEHSIHTSAHGGNITTVSRPDGAPAFQRAGTAGFTGRWPLSAYFNTGNNSGVQLPSNNGQGATLVGAGTDRLPSGTHPTYPSSSSHTVAAADFNGGGKLGSPWMNNSSQFAVPTMNGASPLFTSPFSSGQRTSWHVATGV